MEKRVKWWEIVIWAFMFLSACAFFILGPTIVAWILQLLLILILSTRLVWITCRHTVDGHEKLLVNRRGKLAEPRGPGVVWTMPFLDSVRRVDLRERLVDGSRIHCTTKDSVKVDLEFSFLWRIIDPTAVANAVENPEEALQRVTADALQAAVTGRNSDELRQSKKEISSRALESIAGPAERWSVEVTALMIRIMLPPELEDTFSQETAADRILRRETLAKISALIDLDTAAGTLKNLDSVTRLVLLDTLSKMGQAKSAKYVLPLDVSGLIGSSGESGSAAPGKHAAADKHPASADAAEPTGNSHGE
jgi:hypothetical protein